MKKSLLMLFILCAFISCEEEKKEENKIEKNKETIEQEKKVESPIVTELLETHEHIGTWLISNSMMEWEYEYMIFENNGEYIGIALMTEEKKEELIKKENKYLVKDSKFGEYYQIDEDMNMSLFDNDGELETAGWNAKYIETKD